MALRLLRQVCGVRARPRADGVLVQRLAPGVERVERAELPAAGHLGVPEVGVALAVERALAVAVALAPADVVLPGRGFVHAHVSVNPS
jgi:hypothetical protein